MRIFGIDPGLASTGYGVIEHTSQQSRLVAMGEILTGPRDDLAQRLKAIHDALARAIGETRPEVVCIEQLFHAKSVPSVIAMAQGRGVAILATAQAQLPLVEYTPTEIKQAVAGSGKAAKPQIQRMVKVLLGLNEEPKSTHAADALAVALCHAHVSAFRRAVAAAQRK